MFFFGNEYSSIDSYIIAQFVNNGTSFILFYMEYKPLFSLEFQKIFNRYLIHYLCGNYMRFDGMRHLIKVLHNRILLKNVNDKETCKPLRSINNIAILSQIETKYQDKREMKQGLKHKLKNTIYYKFSSNSVLYKIDNIIKQKYDIHSTELLGFILDIFISLNKANLFIDNFFKTLIKSHLYRNTDKLQIFLLLYSIPKKHNAFRYIRLFNLIRELIITNKYIISKSNKSSIDTLFYNLLSNSDDIHCHDFYKFVCEEYNRKPNNSEKYEFINQNKSTIRTCTLSEFEKMQEETESDIESDEYLDGVSSSRKFNVTTPFKETFDFWLDSVISYEIINISDGQSKNNHTNKFLKSLYYLLIYMLHHTKDKLTKSSLFRYIKKINTIYLSTTIVSIELLESQLDKLSFTILDSLQAENCRVLVNKYKKMIHIRNNIFIKLAFRYSLEYYASNLIKRMGKVSNASSNSLEALICDIKEFIRLVCYYKETSNIKLYKQLNKICIEKILLSKNYKQKYYNLGIYSQNMNEEDKIETNIALTESDEFLNPHFIADYLKFIHFCYPKIKMNKQMYILLVDFFIFTTKEKDVWTIGELDNIWNKLIYLIYKYSNTRKNITFPESEKNIYFIHCILKRLHNMNLDMNGLLQVVNKYRLTSDEAMKKYIDSINYIQNKKNLLYILLRKLKHPKLRDLFYKSAIRDKFVNTLNETLFEYTPSVLKRYFNSYYGRVRKYTNYISNDKELYNIFNSIYECIFKRDMEKGHIKNMENIDSNSNPNSNSNFKSRLYMDEESIFRNILEEPAFFNLKYIDYLGDFKNIKLNGDFKYSILCSLGDYIKQLEFQKTNAPKSHDIDFSDEFLDPIMKTEIQTPIILPGNDTIMDKQVLEEMLLYNNINPFTQEELYMKDVLKYNEEEKSKNIIQNFLKRKKEFVQDHINNLNSI